MTDTTPMSNTPDQRPLRILGIGGSTRRGSGTLVALKSALAMAKQRGATTVLGDIRALDLPMFNDDLSIDQCPDVVRWLVDEARAVDGLILASPTYHGTVTGAVKNALDTLNYLWDESEVYLGNKPVGLMAFGGPSSVNALNALHHSVRGINGLATKTFVSVPLSAIDDTRSGIRDARIRARLETMVDEVIELARLRILREAVELSEIG